MKSESKIEALQTFRNIVLAILGLLSLWCEIRDDVGEVIEEAIESSDIAEELAKLAELLDEIKKKFEDYLMTLAPRFEGII